MKFTKESILLWLPRVLSIILTLLVYGFLFQFSPEDIEWDNFFIALVPGTVVLVITVLSWFIPLVGGILFAVLGAGYAVYAWGKVSTVMVLVLGGLAVLNGVLYILQKLMEPKGKDEEKLEAQLQPTVPTEPLAERVEKAKEAPEDKTVDLLAKEPKEEKPELPPLPPLPPKKEVAPTGELPSLEPKEEKPELPSLPPLPVKREDLPPKVEKELLETPAEPEVPEEEEEKKLLEEPEAPEFMPVGDEAGVVSAEEEKEEAEPSDFGQDLPTPDIQPVELESKKPLPPLPSLPEKKDPYVLGSVGVPVIDVEAPPVKEAPVAEVEEKLPGEVAAEDKPKDVENELESSVDDVLAELKPTPQPESAGLPSWKTSSVGLNIDDKSSVDVAEPKENATPGAELPPLNLTTTDTTAQSGDKLAPEKNVPEDFAAWVNK